MVPQIVVDTNVLFSGHYSRVGPSFSVLDQIGRGRADIHLSVPLVLEYEAVLKRERERLEMTEQEIDAAIDAFCTAGIHHKIHYLWRPELPDPGDDMVLELAVSARCPIIVTHNVRHFRGARRFGIQPLTPLQFLQKIGVHQ